MMCSTVHGTLGSRIRKDTKLKFYKVMAMPVLTYGSETWTLTKSNRQRIQPVEMKFCERRVRGCTLRDQIKNEDIQAELNPYA